MSSNKNPTAIVVEVNIRICPVCGKRYYSLGGIHPQCAVRSRIRLGKRSSEPRENPRSRALRSSHGPSRARNVTRKSHCARGCAGGVAACRRSVLRRPLKGGRSATSTVVLRRTVGCSPTGGCPVQQLSPGWLSYGAHLWDGFSNRPGRIENPAHIGCGPAAGSGGKAAPHLDQRLWRVQARLEPECLAGDPADGVEQQQACRTGSTSWTRRTCTPSARQRQADADRAGLAVGLLVAQHAADEAFREMAPPAAGSPGHGTGCSRPAESGCAGASCQSRCPDPGRSVRRDACRQQGIRRCR